MPVPPNAPFALDPSLINAGPTSVPVQLTTSPVAGVSPLVNGGDDSPGLEIQLPGPSPEPPIPEPSAPHPEDAQVELDDSHGQGDAAMDVNGGLQSASDPVVELVD